MPDPGFPYIDDGVTDLDLLWSSKKINDELALKSDKSHTHTFNDLSDVSTGSPSDGDLLYHDGSNWVIPSGLHWDSTNTRFGIGTGSPQSKLHLDSGNILVQRGASTSAILAGRVDGDGNDVFRVEAYGDIEWGVSPGGSSNRDTRLYRSGASELTLDNTSGTGADLSLGYLTGYAGTPSDGDILEWNNTNGRFEPVANSGGSGPAGSNTEVQFNDNGAFGTDSDFVYVKASNTLGVGTNSPDTSALIHANGSGGDATIRVDTTSADAKYTATILGAQDWAFGADNADSAAFKIANSTALGTNTAIRIDPSTQAIKFNGSYEFPTADGSSKQILQTDGGGRLSFTDIAGGSAGAVQYTPDGSTLAGDASHFFYSSSNDRLDITNLRVGGGLSPADIELDNGNLNKLQAGTTAARTWDLPDKDGTLATLDDTGGGGTRINTVSAADVYDNPSGAAGSMNFNSDASVGATTSAGSYLELNQTDTIPLDGNDTYGVVGEETIDFGSSLDSITLFYNVTQTGGNGTLNTQATFAVEDESGNTVSDTGTSTSGTRYQTIVLDSNDTGWASLNKGSGTHLTFTVSLLALEQSRSDSIDVEWRFSHIEIEGTD